MNVIKAVPTNVITGFLGAGKTTLIQSLLARRPEGEKWAVLVNEFGQVGIDQTAFVGEGVEVKEVPGGCICCANSLPMQIALSQLIARVKPHRVLIEPTGLGHPRQVLELLQSKEWRDTIALKASVCVIDARVLEDARVLNHETFQAQVEVADVIVFSKADVLSDEDTQRAEAFNAALLPPKAAVGFVANGEMDLAWLDRPAAQGVSAKRSLLHMQNTKAEVNALPPQDPPYHYQHTALDRTVAGWVFPPQWQFAHNDLLNVLFSIQGAERIKGVFNTESGWIFFNATSRDTAINSSSYTADSRLEIICENAAVFNWSEIEARIMSCRQDN